MDLPIQIGTFNNVKHAHVICLKSGDIFFSFLKMLLLEAEASICSTVKENLLLCYSMFPAFVVPVTI